MRDNTPRDTKQITTLLSSVGHQQIAIAELEAVGLPLRIINLLEDYLGAIWLEDLLQYTPQQLRDRVPNLGEKSLGLILDSLHALGKVLHRMPQEKKRTDSPPVASPIVTVACPPAAEPVS